MSLMLCPASFALHAAQRWLLTHRLLVGRGIARLVLIHPQHPLNSIFEKLVHFSTYSYPELMSTERAIRLAQSNRKTRKWSHTVKTIILCPCPHIILFTLNRRSQKLKRSLTRCQNGILFGISLMLILTKMSYGPPSEPPQGPHQAQINNPGISWR